jgi:hypothetical protein
VVLDDPLQGKDVGTCGMATITSIAAEVKASLSSLRFNDLVTGMWLMHRDPSAKNLFLGVPTITQLQKIAEPVSYFHPTPGNAKCLNRSGHLLEYITRAGGQLTVYNDGGIQYSTRYGRVFAREGLSADGLKDLLGAFGAAGIDALPDVSDKADQMSGSRRSASA